MAELVVELRVMLQTAGWISVPLVGVSLVLWFMATLRLLALRRGFSGEVPDRVRVALSDGPETRPHGVVDRYLSAALGALRNPDACQHDLERIVEVEREKIRDYGLVLTAFVTVAPLLGLLGTVSGMVEMFASMQGAALARATEQTVAGGISLALVSTQLGLVIGVPGLIASRMLARRESRRARELAQAHSVLVGLRKVPP
ncbi:MAG: MotA/TolQ/ExbB proton channel family protein [Myxococcota bacterium]